LKNLDNRGNWIAKAAYDKNIDKLLGLLLKEEQTYKQLKEKLQVSDPTLSKYLKGLEKEGKIEFFQKPDSRRNKWYRIKPENKDQVKFMLDKKLLVDLIYDLDYPDVLYFLQDFTMDLITLRKEVECSKVDLKPLVEKAMKSAFEMLSKTNLTFT